MFRKMTTDQLPTSDCHYHLRDTLITELRSIDPHLERAPLCISIAWDWYVIMPFVSVYIHIPNTQE